VTVAGSRGYFGLGLLLASPDARLLRRGGRGAVRRLIGWVMTCDGLDPSGALMGQYGPSAQHLSEMDSSELHLFVRESFPRLAIFMLFVPTSELQY
jgi:hypothetical protein